MHLIATDFDLHGERLSRTLVEMDEQRQLTPAQRDELRRGGCATVLSRRGRTDFEPAHRTPTTINGD